MNNTEMPNRSSDCSGQHAEYLKRAADACSQGDMVLGMHLYLAAYEMAVADPNIPDGMALAGLREAWHLACELKERSIAEYVFEKLEPYLTGEEIAACASKLQSLALDRLEEYGFSREELEGMAEMISQDFIGADASVVKVESISIPQAGILGNAGGSILSAAVVQTGADAESEAAGSAEPASIVEEPAQAVSLESGAPEAAPDEEQRKPGLGMSVAKVDDFNPYDLYRDYSIGKSWHSATNEGSGAAVFTRDEERAAAHEQFVSGQNDAEDADAESAAETAVQASADAVDEAQPNPDGPEAHDAAEVDSPAIPVQESETAIEASVGTQAASVAAQPSADIPAMPDVTPVDAAPFNYRTLAGYDDAVAVMRDYGVGLHNDRGFQDFIAMLNQRHGLDRAPALDTFLFRAPVLEDAARFVEATIGEVGLPALRMSMEEGMQGMPVLCITTQGNHRPRMNHAHNRFEAPAVLVLEDLETWYMPEVPEGAEGMAGFVMANISRGAREAVNLIRAAVEDPDVYVLATATTEGNVDPFFYDVLEPLTVIDIGYPNDKERSDIWTEIARNHPSMRMVNRADLMRYSQGLSRYDIYLAARDAIEEAYKLGVVQRTYVAVSPLNIFEKLAACQPLESEEYRVLEERIIASFQQDLDHLDDLIDGLQA